MGVWGWLTKDAMATVDWPEPPGHNILVFRSTQPGTEVKVGGRLQVRDGQTAVFVYEGKVFDPIPASDYTLSERNLNSVLGKGGFSAEGRTSVKLDVYFVSTRTRINVPWGGPVLIRDDSFGPVRTRFSGSCEFRIVHPAVFLRSVLTHDGFETYTTSNLRNVISAHFADAMREVPLPIHDLAKQYQSFSRAAIEKVRADLAAIGVELLSMAATEVNLPPEVARVIDRFNDELHPPGNGSGSPVHSDPLPPPPIPRSGPISAPLPIVASAPAPASYHRSQPMNSPRSGRIFLSDNGPESGVYRSIAAEPISRGHEAVHPHAPSPKVQYFVAVEGAPSQPHDLESLRNEIVANRVTASTMLWLPGIQQWCRAGEIPELVALFASTTDQDPPSMAPDAPFQPE